MLENANVSQKPVEILLVEDNPADAELTLHAFQRQHLANVIHHVHDGAEALDYLFATGQYKGRNGLDVPKLILLDLKLPKVNGIEVLTRIREDPRLKMIPVVILTTSREEKDLEDAYRLGVNSYIVKPVEFDKFTEVVAKLGFYWLVINEQPQVSNLEVK